MGLRAALAHVIAQVPVERRPSLSAALVELERDPLEKVPFRCVKVIASTRSVDQDLKKEKIDAVGQTNLQDDLVSDQSPLPARKNDSAEPDQTATPKPCALCEGNAALDKEDSALQCAVLRKQQQQRAALAGFALLFLVVAISAVAFAVRKKKAASAHERAAMQLDELYNIAKSRSASSTA